MCDDFGSDSGRFDDVGSFDFDGDISSDFDSDVSSDFDTDFSADIDTMDFDDVETMDFDDDVSSDFDASDFSDDIASIDFDDIETIDIDDIETPDFDDNIETLDIEDDIETIDVDNIGALDFDDDIETLDIEDDVETIDVDDDIGALDFDNDIETLDIEGNFDDSDIMDISVEETGFETELTESEEIPEAMATVNSDIDNEMESMDFDAENESMNLTGDSEEIETIDLDDASEDFDLDNEIEDIDISEDIEVTDLNDGVEDEDIEIPDSTENMELDIPNEAEFVTSDGSESICPDASEFVNLDATESEVSDMPTYIDADETTEIPETMDWDSMLSDGDRDYINGIMNSDSYTTEQKDFLVQEALGEIYERETAAPEYGARVKGLTYDGRDIITKPSEDDSSEPYIDEALLDGVLNNENLSSESLSNLRDYLENVSGDESLTDDEKSFLINQALDTTPDTNGISYDSDVNPSGFFEGITESNTSAEVGESINEDAVNEYNEPFSGELSEQDIDTVYEGLSEYDFHGVDCLENSERLDASLENFTAENWENLSIDEQKEKMTDLAQYIIDITGLENPPRIEFYNNAQEGDYGGFDRTTNTLSINEHMLYQNDEAADTIAHELWHALQYQRASNPRTKLDAMYAENFNDYISPNEDFEGYQSQILESEARAFAQQIKDRLRSY